ncbi:MAG: DUF4959 domain-containing protein [Chitinophaga sp.]|uniref:DUF5000 domain-containing lipoprotein n=1 Tax=Chitinophaga sp. TaxID=1869181 RepID=UPI001B2A78F5|nr:DUF5000 domain-containing lipoprotein [Chitinophaga sp.]MBO9727951.1 DUF4959 domain-containing protein [Chitinophaga sp.]
MNKRIYLHIVLISLLVISSCKREEPRPVIEDHTAPGVVTNVSVINLNGSARISYILPKDADLLCIKAVYKTTKGVQSETKVSRYNSSLLVEGFGDTSNYKITLYAVDKSENVSAPVEVTVKPLEPIIWIVRRTISVVPDFGGVNVKFDNAKESDLAVVVLATDSLGAFSPYMTKYTNLPVGDFSTRNMKDVPTDFGVYVRDRWGNMSDTFHIKITPLYEELLDRKKMKGLILPTDAPLGYGGDISGIFDGSTTTGFYHSGDAARMPQWLTYDMGVTAKLSRIVWFMRPDYLYGLHSPRKVEIWGSNKPNPDGSFDDSWILLTEHTQIKPSGLPPGKLSQADMDAAAEGETVTFPLNTPKVRYIRFKTLSNWTNGTYCQFHELMTWGDTK